jgi:hypothetical protein
MKPFVVRAIATPAAECGVSGQSRIADGNDAAAPHENAPTQGLAALAARNPVGAEQPHGDRPVSAPAADGRVVSNRAAFDPERAREPVGEDPSTTGLLPRASLGRVVQPSRCVVLDDNQLHHQRALVVNGSSARRLPPSGGQTTLERCVLQRQGCASGDVKQTERRCSFSHTSLDDVAVADDGQLLTRGDSRQTRGAVRGVVHIGQRE